jgi:hypothetical protein
VYLQSPLADRLRVRACLAAILQHQSVFAGKSSRWHNAHATTPFRDSANDALHHGARTGSTSEFAEQPGKKTACTGQLAC